MPDTKFDKSDANESKLLHELLLRIDRLERHVDKKFLRVDREINEVIDAIINLRKAK